MYDLIIVGGTSQGLSAAVLAKQAGVAKVRLIEQTDSVVYPNLIGEHGLEVGLVETIESIDKDQDSLIIVTDRDSYETRSCIIASRSFGEAQPLPSGIENSDHIHIDSVPIDVRDKDILVVGSDDRAVILCSRFIDARARSVVLAAGSMNPDLLSSASQKVLTTLEQDRLLTPLFRSVPQSIVSDEDGAMVIFDRRTPDLIFDHVVYASLTVPVEPQALGITEEALDSGRLLYTRDPYRQVNVPSEDHRTIVLALSKYFSEHDRSVLQASAEPEQAIIRPALRNEFSEELQRETKELREKNYNATITGFDPTHSDLWRLTVKPDTGDIEHKPGQYTTLALGYWEPRIDDVLEDDIEKKWPQLVRRSYSISNRIFTDDGYLATETQDGELEFYIVLVPPNTANIPGFTPRLALKKEGDRLFMGSKVTGRYTLDAITDPDATVVFLSTGTGEAPHNSMIVQLLRKGHKGKIVSAVNVRKWQDLGYLEEHRELERQFPNYKYIALPTREDNVPKRYMQDLITTGELEEALGESLNPEKAHVYICGNPAMIGAPDRDGNLPKDVGVVELLLDRGFKIDERKNPGNVHFETYW